jgi:hypothetical protein
VTAAEPWRPALTEITLTSASEWSSPFWDVDLELALTSPTGQLSRHVGFWDGDGTWRVRLRPDQPGEWRWQSHSNDPDLDGRHGTVAADWSERFTRFDRHGPVEVAADGYTFTHTDTTPFLWIGDTVWNGPLRAAAGDWDAYLQHRAVQGFTVVQVFTLNWRGLGTDADGRVAFTIADGRTEVEPAFFQRFDDRVAAANDQGLLVSAIVVLALYDEDAGQAWSEGSIARYARWLRARWAGYQVAWSLGGDGDFTGARAEKWKRLGRQVYSDPPERLVTMHPCGKSCIAEEFRDESWMTFHVYQSGHAGDDVSIRWHTDGPYNEVARRPPARPIVNIEPNYEDHPGYVTDVLFTPADVRRAAYWSVLGTGPAGVGYGQYSLWAWAPEPEPVGEAIRSQPTNMLAPWHTVVDTPAAAQMGILRGYLESGPWGRLRPDPATLQRQPGADDVVRHQSAARTDDRVWTAIYVPDPGGDVVLAEPATGSVRWFDPATGAWRPAASDDGQHFSTPTAQDWVLDSRTDPTT